MKSPCRNCPNRRTMCHGQCSAYRDWRAAVDAAREQEKHTRALIYLSNYSTERQIKSAKLFK